jgi:hypothetical protein
MHRYRQRLSFGIVLEIRLNKIVHEIRTHSVLATVFYSGQNGFAFLPQLKRYIEPHIRTMCDMWHKIVIFGPKNAITRRKSMGTDLCIAGNDGVMRVQGMGGSIYSPLKISKKFDSATVRGVLTPYRLKSSIKKGFAHIFWLSKIELVHTEGHHFFSFQWTECGNDWNWAVNPYGLNFRHQFGNEFLGVFSRLTEIQLASTIMSYFFIDF